MKPDCYKCIHRREIPGDAHSRCVHPSLGQQDDNPFSAVVALVRGAADGTWKAQLRALGITAHTHGVRSGWFMWPANFDPVWLLTCNGFEQKQGAA